MTNVTQLVASSNGRAETLTTETSGIQYGYRLVGAKPGPLLVTVGICPSAERVFQRLLTIPTLPWMRGSLVLIRLDALDNMFGELSALATLGPVDRTVVLPWNGPGETDDRVVRRSYHTVLRACADLGMIAGRGVAMEEA